MYYFTDKKIYLSLISHNVHFCKVTFIFDMLSNSCSNTLPLLLAFDRLHAFYFPFNYRMRTVSYAKRVGCTLCVINTLIIIPIIIFIQPYDIVSFKGEADKYCWINQLTIPYYFSIYTIVFFSLYINGFLPMVTLFIANVFIVYKTINILKTSKGIKNKDTADKDLKNATQTGITLIMLSVMYLIVILPSTSLYLLTIYREISHYYSHIHLHYIDQTRLNYIVWLVRLLVNIFSYSSQ